MTKSVTIGRRLIPLEHIALIEPFDAASQARLDTERAFLTRVVLIDRDSVLSEEAPGAFAEAHGFRMLAEDGVATNPAIRFRVETFEPAEGFRPQKPFKTRLMWRDLDGSLQSKLLLTPPGVVLAVAVRGEAPGSQENDEPEPRSQPNDRPRRRRRTPRPPMPSVVPG
jgi:hypothetical protein